MAYIMRVWREEDEKVFRNLNSYTVTMQSIKKNNSANIYALEQEEKTIGLAATNIQGKDGELFLCLLPDPDGIEEIIEFIRELCEAEFKQGAEEIYCQVISICAAEIEALETAGFKTQGILRQSLPDGKKIVDFCIYVLKRP